MHTITYDLVSFTYLNSLILMHKNYERIILSSNKQVIFTGGVRDAVFSYKYVESIQSRTLIFFNFTVQIP